MSDLALLKWQSTANSAAAISYRWRGLQRSSRGESTGALLVGLAGVGVDPCDSEIGLIKPYRFEGLVEGMEAFLALRASVRKRGNGSS